MNRKPLIIAIGTLIAIYLGVHLNSAFASRWIRCPIVSKYRLTCNRNRGWIWGSNKYKHVETCAAGHRYWACHTNSRRVHAAHRAPAPTPAPTPAPRQSQTTSQTQTRSAQQQPARQQQQPAAAPTFSLGKCKNEMPEPGKLYTFTISATNLGSRGKIEASLSDVTNWRGDYGNYPLATGKPSRDSDLKLLTTDNAGWKAVGTDGLKLRIENTTSFSGELTVRCYDSAAYGELTVKATSSSPSVQIISDRQKIPCDANGNKISDAWSHNTSYPTLASAIAASSDAEQGHSGNNQHGDGFTAFEEYRGFKTGSGAKPTRLDPTRKEVFIVVGPNLSSYGIGHATRLETDATIKPVTIDKAYVNNWDGDGLDNTTEHLDGLMNGNNNDPSCRARRVYAIRLIRNSGSKQDANGDDIMGEVAEWPPCPQSLAQIYVNSATAAQLPFVIAHEIGHAVNLDHCPGSEYPNFPSRSPLPACLMVPRLSSTAVYGSAHNVDYDLVNIASNSRRRTPQQAYVVSPTPSSGGGSGGDDDDDDDDDDDSGDSGGDTAPAAQERTTRPTTVACGNRWRDESACSSGGRAASRYEHQTTCGAGHTYWSCNRNAVAWHATTYTCTRPGCSDTFTRCTMDTGSARSCRSNGRNYRWHNR